jgi:hypothetical protein
MERVGDENAPTYVPISRGRVVACSCTFCAAASERSANHQPGSPRVETGLRVVTTSVLSVAGTGSDTTVEVETTAATVAIQAP